MVSNAARRAWVYWLLGHCVFKLCGGLGALDSGASLADVVVGGLTGFGTDILVGAVLFVPPWVGASRWPERFDRPGLARALKVGSGVAGAYVALNGYLIYAVGVPLTYRLLVYTRSVQSSWEVLEPLPLLLVMGGVAVIVFGGSALERWSRRQSPRRWWVGLVAMGVVGLAAPSVGLSAASRWGLNREPVWVLVRSMAGAGAAGARANLESVDRWEINDEPPEASYLEPVAVAPEAVKPRHVVLWIGEGVGARYLPLYGSDVDTTPRLTELAKNALVFDRFYANVPISIKALFDLVCGTYPYPDKEFITHINPRIACPSLMESLGNHGYVSGLFHGGIFGFTDKLSFFGGRGLDIMLDAESIPDAEDYFTNGWGIDDRALVDHGLRWVDSHTSEEGSPATLAIYVPIIPHYPYFLPPDAPRPWPGKRGQNAYRNGVHYTDGLFGDLYDGYVERGLAADTLFVFIGDHGQAFYQHPRNKLHGHQLYEENVHVPFVVINASLFPNTVRTGRLGSHVDVAPTLFELLGLPKPPGWQGQSVVGEPFSYRAAPFFTFYSEPRMGLRVGDWKLIWNQLDDSLEAYDLVKDPYERVNRLAMLPFDAAPWKARLRRFQYSQAEYIGSHAALDPHYLANLIEHAQVEVETSAGVTPCEDALPQAIGWGCPGQPKWVFARLEKLRVYNIDRECIRVHPPPEGRMRIRFAAPEQPPRLLGAGLWDAAARKGGTPVVTTWRVGEQQVTLEATNQDVYDAVTVERALGEDIVVEIESVNPDNRTTCLTLSP